MAANHSLSVLVRKLESIATLSDEERHAVGRLPVTTRVLKPDQDILREGDLPSQCCLVVEGWTCRYKMLSEGRRQILSFHIPGDVPDLQSLLIRRADHNLGTLTQATVAFIPHEALRALVNRYPNLAATLWRDSLIDAAIFRAWIVGLGRRTAFQRIAHLFCELYVKLQVVGLAGEHRCPVPLTQADLADALGLSTVHVNRVLQTLRSQGLITFRSSILVVEAWDALCEAGEFDPAYLHLERRAA